MSSLFDRVMFTVSGTPGAGTITVGGAVLDGVNGDRLTMLLAGVPDGSTVSYVAVDGHNWGKGRGVTGSSGTTLTRDAAEVTWNGSVVGSTPISLTSGAVVFLTAIHTDLPQVVEAHTFSGVTSVAFTTWYSSDFTDYDIEFENIVPASSAGALSLQVSSNGGSTYDTTSGHYAYSTFSWSTGGSGVSGNASTTALQLYPGIAGRTMQASANQSTSGSIRMINPAGGASLYVAFTGGFLGPDSANTTQNAQTADFRGYYSGLAAVNAFKIVSSGPNISGTIRVVARPKL